ncbi:hypothetical protein G6F31_020125 [Rhizopus arrhizus]|nr:hypothetical protein G6F31_020125 [Rhizopus arrhizus]
MRAMFAEESAVPAALTVPQFTELVETDAAKWKQVARDRNISIQLWRAPPTPCRSTWRTRWRRRARTKHAAIWPACWPRPKPPRRARR